MNAEQSGFDVVIEVQRNGTIEDWRSALSVPASEVPELTDREKQSLRKFGAAEKDMEKVARGRLVFEATRKRLEGRAEKIGRIVVEVLREIGSGWRLESVMLRKSDQWLLLFAGPSSQTTHLEIPRRFGDDLVDSVRPADQQFLRQELVGRLEQVLKPGTN
jgi:hypothetical protein